MMIASKPINNKIEIINDTKLFLMSCFSPKEVEIMHPLHIELSDPQRKPSPLLVQEFDNAAPSTT